MDQILFFKPFDYFYFNATTRNFVSIIEKMDNVTVVDYSNFEKFKNYNHDTLVIYLPFTLFGVDLKQYNRVYSRLSKAYNVPLKNVITFDIASKFYKVFFNIYNQSTKTIALLSEYDPHALLEDGLMINYLQRDTDYLLLSGPELYDVEFHKKQKPDIDMVKFDRAYNFLKMNEKRIISLSHFVDISEFSCIDELKIKSRVCSAPGARYLNRKLFISNYVSSNMVDYLKSMLDFFILKLIWRIPVPKFKIGISKYYFDNIIKSSVFTYTCGSTAGFFIRKFLEIPVYSSCLITHNYKFLEALGFKDGLHYLNFDDLKTQQLIKNTDLNNFQEGKITEVIKTSRRLIFNNHSTFSYFKYLKITFSRIQEGKFNGSYWSNGEYKLR